MNVILLIKCMQTYLLIKIVQAIKAAGTSPTAPGSHEQVSVNLAASHPGFSTDKEEKGFECHEEQSTFQPHQQFSPFCR